ncbi:MAG: type II toxin-antitoxin system VapC family toxin [Thermoplasmatota archaeon]|nr:type II toxin-antitoxin system VapC family toxin [Halobacteriales archaeon]
MSDGALRYILDASVIAKLVADEPGSLEFRAWSAEHAGDDLRAPMLAFSEVGRVIQKGRGKSEAKRLAQTHVETMEDIQLVPTTAADGDGVWKIASGLPFYDAEYVRLAQRLGGVLVTADRKMAERARKAGVQVKEF